MKKFFEIVIVSLIMTALALVSTFPLVKSFTKAIPWTAFREDISWSLLNHPGDHLQVFYFFWLVKQNLLGLIPFNANPYEFNMLGGQTAGNDGLTTAPLAFISFVFSPLGDVTAYNCTVISSYVLAGVFMYLLARMITKFMPVALLVAVMFTFIPLRINGVGGGNQYGFVLFMYPMIFYFMEKCIRDKKSLYAILAGLGIVGLSFNEPHLIYYLYFCLAGYLPIRFISLLPANKSLNFFSPPEFRLGQVLSWPSWLSLLIIYGGGAAIVVYAHRIIPLRGNEAFFSNSFCLMLAYYPFILLFFSLMLASIFCHLSDTISHSQGLAIEAGSMLPLYLFLPMALFQYRGNLETAELINYSILAVLLLKLWLLKPHLRKIVYYLWEQTKAMRSLIFIFSPAILAMVGNAVMTVINKKNSIAPSTESGGRTLADVRLFSASLQDLFHPTSSVYIGFLPIAFGVVFLCYLLYKAVWIRKKVENPSFGSPMYYFLAVVLLVSHVLAMGLAIGNRSLYILFFNYVPFFNVPRISDRILCVTIFVLACITAGAGNALFRLFQGRIWTFCCSLLFLVLTVMQLKSYSINVPMALTDLQPIEDGYQYIKDNIGDDVLLELPLWPGDSHQSSVYEYYITLDKIKRLNGYTPLVSREYIKSVFDPLHSLDRGFLDQKQYDLLRKLKVKFITVHEHSDIFTSKVSPFSPLTTVRRLRMSPYLEYVGPWDIVNEKYNKLHERLSVFRVKDGVYSGKANDFYVMPTIYRAGGLLRQLTGQVSYDESIGRKVYNALPGRDAAGFLTYGPYRSFFRGKYRCYFSVKCNDAGTEKVAGKVDVVRLVDQKPDILTSVELVAGKNDGIYQNYYLDFEITKRERLGFRVYYLGTHEISLDKVVVARKDSGKNINFLEAEKMVGETGRIVSVTSASGQKVIEAKPGKGMSGRIVFGTDRRYDKGKYSALFYLRVPEDLPTGEMKGNSKAVVLSVSGNQGESVFVRKTIRTSRIRGDAFKVIRLDFTISKAEEIAYTVYFKNRVTVQLDGVKVVKNN